MDKLIMLALSLSATGVIGATVNKNFNEVATPSVVADVVTEEAVDLSTSLEADVALGVQEVQEEAGVSPTPSPAPGETSTGTENEVEPSGENEDTSASDTSSEDEEAQQPAESEEESTESGEEPEAESDEGEVALQAETGVSLSLPQVKVNLLGSETSGISLSMGL